MRSRSARLSFVLAAGLTFAALPSLAQEALRPEVSEGRILDCRFPSTERGCCGGSSLRAVAENGLRKFIHEIREGRETGTPAPGFPFDVQDLSELDGATLGYAFQVHTVDPRRLAAEKTPLQQLMEPLPIWNFLVMVEERPVALLEVQRGKGGWEVVAAGGSELARDLHLQAETHARGQAFRFLRVYQATSDVLEVAGGGEAARYLPLVAARESLRTSQVLDGESMAAALRQAVQQNRAR